MKTFSKIVLIFIFLFLIGISVAEEIITSKSLSKVNEYCFVLEEEVEGKKDIRTSKLCLIVDNMQYDWTQDEMKMCYLVNHKSIQEIGAELAKMKNYLGENDVKEFKASLEAIKFYSESYLHFMGANIHNIL